MVIAEAPSALEQKREKLIELYKKDLRLVPGLYIPPIFRWEHLDKQAVIIGFIGDRGSGKSASAASVALVDIMLQGKTVWSNMDIACQMHITDEEAQAKGRRCGGDVIFKSEKLENEKLIKMSPEYSNGAIFTDEVNMEFAESRRSMSNTNLFMDNVAQQVRKFGNWWIYSVINEMFVDSRLRELTDIFIRCQDTALTIDGLLSKKQPGIDFKWTIYPMTGYLRGEEGKYSVTQKPLYDYFHFEPFRGIYNDKQAQAVGKTKYGIQLNKQGQVIDIPDFKTEQSAELQGTIKDLSWLETIANEICADGRRFIPAEEIWQRSDVQMRQISKNELSTLLRSHFQIYSKERKESGKRYTAYEVPENFLLTV